MKRTSFYCASWAFLMATLAAPAFAAEYVPVWTGQPGTTMQKWTFDTDDNPVVADISDNIYGLAELNITPADGAHWLSADYGQYGVWPLSGYFNCSIANIHVMDKEILIGGRWRPEPIDPVDPWLPRPIFEIQLDDGDFQAYDAELVHNEPVGQWYDVAFKININSDTPFQQETIKVSGDMNISTLRIDTFAIPEPLTVILLACGALAQLRRRR